MQGKVVVVSGGTSGIGRVAAETLAQRGARIVLIARDKARAEETLAALRARGVAAHHSVHYADLMQMTETRRVGAQIAAAEPRIDVLINNAGAIFAHRRVTAEGLEATFALNHMSYFVLTEALRERLAASAPARIVNTASGAHRSGHLDLNDLQSARSYNPFRVYGTTKLCNILYTRELARRLAGSGITANCLHPGFVATRFGDEAGGLYSWGVRIAKLFALTPEQGAQTIVHLASSPEVAGMSGGYFEKCRPKTPNAEAQDDGKARRLWEESERIGGRL